MDIKLDSPNFQEVFKEALLKSLDENKREVLISNAITHLLTNTPNSYSRDTYLDVMFKEGVRNYVKSEIEKQMKDNPTIKDAINGYLSKAVAKIVEDNDSKLSSALADAIVAAIKNY